MSQLVEDLKAAKALIDTPEKWWNGRDKRLPGQRDAIDAIYDASGLEPELFEALDRRLRDAIPPRLLAKSPHRKTSRFNDDPTTTHADIMALFDRAIASAEAA